MRWPVPARVVIALAVVATPAGAVVAFATDERERDPAPPAARADRPGLVTIGRPIAPYPAGAPATGRMVLRAAGPAGNLGVLFHRDERRRRGRLVRAVCFESGHEDILRRYPVHDGGSCLPASGSATGEPWSVAVSQGADGLVTIQGSAGRDVRRLTVAGPGGTFVVPRSREGAFLVVYWRRAEGRAVLTATLSDGTTRYFRTAIPPTMVPEPGGATAPDPEGLPEWHAQARLRDDPDRRGQTCLQVTQQLVLRAPRGRQGGAITPPTCGDLRKEPAFVRTVDTGRAPRSQFAMPGQVRRTVLAGAVDATVRGVAVIGPSGRRALELSDDGRAFLAVFPASVRAGDLTVELTFAGGRVRRIADTVAFNRATSPDPPPKLRGRVSLAAEPARSRRVVLRATLTGLARRFEITFLGREVRMRRTGGADTSPEYTGVYHGERGVRRAMAAKTSYSVLICGSTCTVRLTRGPVREAP